MVGHCGPPPEEACGRSFGLFLDSNGKTKFRTWIADTRTTPGRVLPGGTYQRGKSERIWRALDIRIPTETAKKLCCWQQVWGVMLPESSVDWATVNDWAQRGDADHKLLAQAIRQAVDAEEFTSAEPDLLARGVIAAPSGYGCGILLFPGPGCDQTQDEDWQTSNVEVAISNILSGVQSEASNALTGYEGQAYSAASQGLTAINQAIGDIASDLSAGIFDSMTEGVNEWSDKVTEAKSDAAAIEDDFWKFTIGHTLLGADHPKPDIREYFPGNAKSAVGPVAAGEIKSWITVAWYLMVTVFVARMFIPKTTPVDSNAGG